MLSEYMGSQVSDERRPGVREILDAIRNLVRALRLGNQEAERRVGLSSAQLFVLQTLSESDGLSLKELAQRTATDPSSVSVVVARLVSLRLVSRARDAKDGRRLVLGLTARARALMRKAPPRLVQHGLVRAIESLAAGDRRTLARLLKRIAASMGEADDAPGMFFEPLPKTARGRRSRVRHGS
jgi:DNA-binding MarR family transcriptional regulator